MSVSSIRAFVGLAIPQSMSFQMAEISARMAALDKGKLVWVPEDNYHLTLLFLGQQEEQWLDDLAHAINEHVALSSQLLVTQQIMPFPESSPKIVAALIEQSEALSTLYKQVKKAAMICGMAVEKRRFRPHITLARKYPRQGQQLMPAAMDKLTDEATRLIIYESHLSPSGAEYEPLYEFDLV